MVGDLIDQLKGSCVVVSFSFFLGNYYFKKKSDLWTQYENYLVNREGLSKAWHSVCVRKEGK